MRNKTGFSALPGGLRYDGGYFSGMVYGGYWWSSTESSSSKASDWNLNYGSDAVDYYEYNPKSYGFSVRCVRD
jgi:uncharacterized protein (TIGR02145 family)